MLAIAATVTLSSLGHSYAQALGVFDGALPQPSVREERFLLAQGTTSYVAAMTEYQGRLVLGGSFDYAGTVRAGNLAQWDGQYWFEIPIGVGGTEFPAVYALAVFDGELIVGGDFTSAGGVPVRYLARWNGVRWDSLGSGLEGPVQALYAEGDSVLIAGGTFLAAGAEDAHYVARWSGTQWQGMGAGFDSTVYALTRFQGDIIAGGAFSTSDGVAVRGVARWTSSGWDSLGSGVDVCTGYGCPARVESFLPSGDSLLVGGTFKRAGGVTVNGIALWHQQTWSGLGSGFLPPDVRSLQWYKGKLVAAGDIYTSGLSYVVAGMAEWTGSQWLREANGLYGGAYALTEYQGLLHVGGYFSETYFAPSISLQNMATWDGAAWAPLIEAPLPSVLADSFWWNGFTPENGLNGKVNAIAEYEGDIIVGGEFTMAGGDSIAYIARWDGAQWHPLGLGVSYVVYALCVWDGQLIVGGAFTAAGGSLVNCVASWNGTDWSDIGEGTNAPVYSLVVWNDTLFLGGDFTRAGGLYTDFIAGWDGTSWLQLAGGVNGAVFGLAQWDNSLVATGSFWMAGGVSARHVAMWDGVQWSALGVGLGNDLDDHGGHAITVRDTTLIVGGEFYVSGALPVATVAQWSVDAAWDSVGTGFQGGVDPIPYGIDEPYVAALMVHGGQLVAGGVFLWSGESDVRGLGRWTGDRWEMLGTSVTTADPWTDGVFALLSSGGHLYVGGTFTHAGGKPASNIARWDGPIMTSAPPRDRREDTPAPTRASLWIAGRQPSPTIELHYTIPTASAARLALYDVTGREVARIMDGAAAQGQHHLRWRWPSEQLSAGVYVVRLEAAGAIREARFVLVH